MPNYFRFPVLLIWLLWTSGLNNPCFAQPGLNEFSNATSEIASWYYYLHHLVMVIGAISGLAGGAKVYINWQNGKHHIDSEVAGWFFACVFLNMVGAIIQALFL